jgi:hypothetical protein
MAPLTKLRQSPVESARETLGGSGVGVADGTGEGVADGGTGEGVFVNSASTSAVMNASATTLAESVVHAAADSIMMITAPIALRFVISIRKLTSLGVQAGLCPKH